LASWACSLFAFYLMPPVGFILDDTPPYPAMVLVKRIFIFLYYGITPWFILHYSGYPKKWPGYVLSGIAVVCYGMLFFTPESPDKPLWSKVALLNFGGILLLGLFGARFLQRQNQRKAAVALYFVMCVYCILFILTAINQLLDNALANYFDLELFFPIHFHTLVFMMVMGQHLVLDMFEKSSLEDHIRSTEVRWRSFVKHTPFIMLETDISGKILFINPFGATLLGYKRPDELVGLNWFDTFVSRPERKGTEARYARFLNGDETNADGIRTQIRTRDGMLLTINWSAFAITDAEGKPACAMSIGRNITEEESAAKLVAQLKDELMKEELTGEPEFLYPTSEIIGSSKALAYALQKANQVAITHAPVLLEGETGVGKELFANFIHNHSSRSQKPFIKINCGALPKELIEDELFGHEKGAFTSAIQVRKGRFELADGGTLFLDEIGELPLEMQPKLLRVLQTGEFERIGGQKTIKVNVRVLAATNRTLSAEVQNSNFRSDLYYRLNVFPITIPALRQRKEDLPMLVHHFIASESGKYGKSFTQVTHAGMQRLLEYEWPGNIRELKNVIERAVIVSEGSVIKFDWWESSAPAQENFKNEDNRLERIERDHILVVMERCNWKINGENGAAETLAMNPNTLRSKMKRLGIVRPAITESPSTSSAPIA
jgi:PAS domain S-box-containing protein